MRKLEYFIKLAEIKNFSQAAKECSITQTAMSQCIKSMEKELGFKLLERTTRQVILTEAGENLYKKGKVILSDYQQTVTESRQIAEGSRGILNICVPGYSEGNLFMPRILAFKKAYPDISINISVRNLAEIQESLHKGICDIAICWPYDFEQDEVELHHLAEFRYIIVCLKSHPLAKKSSVTLQELQKERLLAVDIENQPHAKFHVAMQFHAQGQAMLQTKLQNIVSIQEIILQLYANPDMAAFVPVFIQPMLSEDLCVIPVEDRISISLSAAVNRAQLTPAAGNLLEILSDSRIPLQY